MTIDEAEKLANHLAETEQRDLRDIAECRRMEAIETLTGAAREATESAAKMARAYLAVLPLVRTAIAHERHREECQRTGRGHDRLLIASEALEDAVDAVLAAEMPAPKELDQ